MTLRRKGIITQPQGLVLYGLILLLGMIVIVHDLNSQGLLYIAITFGNIAALLRFELGMNKYILWAAMTVALHYLLIGQQDEQVAPPHLEVFQNKWFDFSIASTAVLLLGGTRRQFF